MKHFEVHGVFDRRQRNQDLETLRKEFSQESEAAIKLSLKIVGGESSFNLLGCLRPRLHDEAGKAAISDEDDLNLPTRES